MSTLSQAVIATSALLLIFEGAVAQESTVALKDGPGKEKTMLCAGCHSLDYIQMNSPFLDRKGWRTSVNKMINAFGAPISKDDAEEIVNYLDQNYGKPSRDASGS